MKRDKFLQGCLFTVLVLSSFTAKAQGGPTQPEYIDFKPVGTNNLVDNFSGDMSYSIPLLDIEGFPVVLNYTGNVSNNEDASWVGLGWNLNVGSISRQLRGIPDEFNGSDKMFKELKTKSVKQAGIYIEPNFQAFNWQPLKRLDLGIGLSLGIFYNNITGWGHELGISPTFSLSNQTESYLTAGVGLKSNTESGLDISPIANIAGQVGINSGNDNKFNMSLSFNNRTGLKNIGFNMNLKKKADNVQKSEMDGGGSTMASEGKNSIREGGCTGNNMPEPQQNVGAIFSKGLNPALPSVNSQINEFTSKFNLSNMANHAINTFAQKISFASNTYNPTINMPMSNTLVALCLNIEGSFFGLDAGGHVMGNYSVNRLRSNSESHSLYGYLNSEIGKNNENAVLDFNRINDLPYHEYVPTIGVPNHTYDLFMVNQPHKSSQYRIYKNSSGILFDRAGSNNTDQWNLGAELGAGWIFQGGVTLNTTIGNTTTKKWKDNNDFISKGDFVSRDASNPLSESYYIKSSDELAIVDDDFYKKIGEEDVLNVSLYGPSSASSNFKQKSGNPYMPSNLSSMIAPSSNIKKDIRQESFSFLTHGERKVHGFEKEVRSYSGFNYQNYTPITNLALDHHISEVTITNDDGKRHIFGIPVYNNFQKEVTFSLNASNENPNGTVNYTSSDASLDNKNGTYNYFNSEKMPAYPTSWLLTAILSKDYQDVTGNGISDDDIGTAYKINYSRLNGDYQWRVPATRNAFQASYDKGLFSDDKDDKGNYVYGSREEWYIHSIESRNYVAFYHVSTRKDALGQNEHGGNHLPSQRYKLDSISLYFKKDLNNGIANAIPMKVVRLNYDYTLCKDIENSIVAGEGKLSLNSVRFTYGASRRSDNSKYQFHYDNNPNFKFKNVDRWGNYKDELQNIASIKNEEFPYTNQNKSISDGFSSAWMLSRIKLPSGSEIKFEFEADDYSFIQDKRAGYLQQIIGISDNVNGKINNELYDSDENDRNYVFFKFPNGKIPANKDEMSNMYFSDVNNLKCREKLYFKFNVELFPGALNEIVANYADIEDFGIRNSDTGWIKLREVEDNNPMAFYAWQLGKTQVPMKAYPWSKVDDNLGPFGFILALKSFFGNLSEFFEGYDGQAKDYSFARKINSQKSFIRLLKPDYNKIGGGYRVKRVEVNDNWSKLTNNSNNKDAIYGTVYEYKLDQSAISSGVAEYEPLTGGDENPIRHPLTFPTPTNLFGPSTYQHIDEPILESFYPSPRVGYSRIKTRSINSVNSHQGIGWDVFEYYTAKEFPIETDRTHLNGNVHKYETDLVSKFLKIEDRQECSVSQGNVIILNNMHGKEKAIYTFAQDSSTIVEKRFNYDLKDGKLNNYLNVIDETGNISKKRMGVSFDFYSDMRESKQKLTQRDMELGGGFFLLFLGFVPLPIPHTVPFQPAGTIENNFYSSSTLKYIRKVGIVKSVDEFKDGASNTTENLLFDKNTGQAVLIKQRNNYKDSLYTFYYPAYWKYNQFDLAYKTLGINLPKTDIINGNVSSLNKFLTVGDILSANSLVGDNKYWVIDNPNNPSQFKLIDRLGKFANVNTDFKLVQTGRKNILHEKMFYAHMYTSPLNNDYNPTSFSLSVDNRILESNGTEYSDRWKIVKNSKVNRINCNDDLIINKGNVLWYGVTNNNGFINWLNTF